MFLLPHSYKKKGMFMAPLGFIGWLLMQRGYINVFLSSVLGKPERTGAGTIYHTINVTVAILSFFSFLAGLYFITFSKEKTEDEMVQKTRLDSFQFAAFLQIIFTIVGFTTTLILGDPGESGMMLFFIGLVSLFWLSFMGRFNYVLHVKFRQ